MNKFILYIVVLFFAATFVGLSQNEYAADTDATQIKWTGKKVTGEHWGYVPLDSGTVLVENGRIKSGEFSVNLNQLEVKDIEDPDMNAKLTGHLKSPDFFSVAKYPKAYFRIDKALVNAFATDGEPNYTFSGELTIKGITHPITFPAIVSVTDNKINVKANFVFNRAKYEMKFRSGSFFENLGDKMIYDEVPLYINFVANKTEEIEED